MTGVVRDCSTTRLLKVSSVTSMTAVPCTAFRPGLGGLLLALSGGLPGTEVDGTVNRKITRLHVSILPYARGILTSGARSFRLRPPIVQRSTYCATFAL